MSWKQPIPTNLKEIFGGDYLGMNLYVWLLLNSANKDGNFTDPRHKIVAVKRGQTIFGRNEYGKLLNCSPKTAERTLSRICLNPVLKLTKQATTNFTVVTIENYDEIVEMTKQRPSNDQAMTTSKSVKNNKEKKIKKKRKPQGVLFGSLPPLDYPHIYQIAQEMMVTIDDVRQIDKEVRLSVETGNKYNLTNQVNAVRLWVNNALKRGEIQVRNEVEDMIFSHQSPEELAHDKVIIEQLKVKYPNLI